MKDEKALVMLLTGPALDMSILSVQEKRVGSQFFTARPGKPGTAK